MADIALNSSGDVLIENDALSLIDGDYAIIQQITIRLKFFLGEWFLDTRIGMPYYEKILKKNPNLGSIRTAFRNAVLTTPGIERLQRFDLSIDSAQRVLSVSFTAKKTDSDEPLEYDEEFIL